MITIPSKLWGSTPSTESSNLYSAVPARSSPLPCHGRSKLLAMLPRNSNSLSSWSLELCHPYFHFPPPPKQVINIATKRLEYPRQTWWHTLTTAHRKQKQGWCKWKATHGHKVKPCLKHQIENALWLTPVILALGEQKVEQEFRASLSYKVSKYKASLGYTRSQLKSKEKSLRNSSAAERMVCSCRVPEHNPQHLCWVAHNSLQLKLQEI